MKTEPNSQKKLLCNAGRLSGAILFAIFSFLFLSCLTDVTVVVEGNRPEAGAGEQPVTNKKSARLGGIWMEVKKWHGGKRAAVALTYDTPYQRHPTIVKSVDEVVKRGMKMDMELISSMYLNPGMRDLIPVMRDSLIPLGIKFFGHGHEHIQHDLVPYDSAFRSFKTNYDLMASWDIPPRLYAYPGCSGFIESTRKANADAGFLASRGCTLDSNAYIMLPEAGTREIPFYNMPAVAVGRGASHPNHEQLAPWIDKTLEAKGFIIFMYHAIGFEEGFGYYPQEDFIKDLDYIKNRDIWNANMENIVLYIQERNNFRYDVYQPDVIGGYWDAVASIDDGLDDAVYNQPLTVELTLAKNKNVTGAHLFSEKGLDIRVPARQNTMTFDILPRKQNIYIHFFREDKGSPQL